MTVCELQRYQSTWIDEVMYLLSPVVIFRDGVEPKRLLAFGHADNRGHEFLTDAQSWSSISSSAYNPLHTYLKEIV